jgi:hypothetical protein
VPTSPDRFLADWSDFAKFAAHSTDTETDLYSGFAIRVAGAAQAYQTRGSPFRLKEFVVMRAMFAALKPSVTTFLAGVLAWSVSASMLLAQGDKTTPAAILPSLTTPDAPAPANGGIVDPNVQPASGCASCGLRGSGGLLSYGGCSSCGGGDCYPGRKPCDLGFGDSFCGRLFNGLCCEICCPDPCYEPSWIAAANAAFFQDSPRPVTQTRIRWDDVFHYNFPDTSEYLWKQEAPKGIGPKISPYVNYNSLSLYQEVAAKNASFFVEFPYYSIEPANNQSSAGFGDMNLGVKTVLFDRDLILITSQFRTYILMGNPTTGTGNGHVSLEPSILAALKLTPTTYLQMQLAEWIPLGGDPGFEGSIFHFHFSLNQQLCHYGECLNVVGTLEFNGYNFRGQFTDPTTGNLVDMAGSTFLSAGPGLRFQFCDRADLGFGMAFGFGNQHGPDQMYRTEFRIRY